MLAVPVGGRDGVPSSGVSAVVVTVTVVHPGGGRFVSVSGAGMPRPSSSVLDFGAGQTVAGTAVVPLGAGGGIDVVNGSASSTDLLVDVMGYLARPDAYLSSTGGAGDVQDNPSERALTARTAQSLHSAWSSTDAVKPEKPPAIRDGIAYIDAKGDNTSHARLEAVDVVSGTVLWSVGLPQCGSTAVGVALDGNLAVQTCYNPATLIAIDLDTHRVVWTRQVGDVQTYSSTVATDGMALALNDSGVVVGLDLDSGQVRFTVQPRSTVSSFTAADGQLVIDSDDLRVYNDRTGRLLWRSTVPQRGNVEVDAGHIISTGYYGYVSELPEAGCAAATCSPTWTVNLAADNTSGADCYTEPGGADGTTIVVTVHCTSDRLQLLNEDDGTTANSIPMPAGTSPAYEGASRIGDLLWISVGGSSTRNGVMGFNAHCTAPCDPIADLLFDEASGNPPSVASGADGTVFLIRWIGSPSVEAFRPTN